MQKDFVQYFFLNCGYNWVIFCAIRFTALHIFSPTWMFLERYFRKESILFAKFYINYKFAFMLVDFSIQERICSISTWAHLWGSEASFLWPSLYTNLFLGQKGRFQAAKNSVGNIYPPYIAFLCNNIGFKKVLKNIIYCCSFHRQFFLTWT